MWSTFIVFADTANARKNGFATVHILDCHFPEEKQYISIVLYGTHKGRLIELLAIVLLGSLWFAVYEGICSGEIRHRGRVQMAVWSEQNKTTKRSKKWNRIIQTFNWLTGKHISAIMQRIIRTPSEGFHLIVIVRNCTIARQDVVVPAKWLVRICPAKHNPVSAYPRVHPNVVLAVLIQLTLERAKLPVGIRRGPRDPLGRMFNQPIQADVVQSIPRSYQYRIVVLI